MSVAFFDSSQSASFECLFSNIFLDATLGFSYKCHVRNSVSITSFDAAAVDEITGEHKSGFKNDNVEGFYISSKGQIHYFPRGLDKFFKNLKGIQISDTGLKEIHQSDLKHFTQLKVLYLFSNQLEVLEENLFEFNPNLELINLDTNKISYIDPNVFDKLTKLKNLYLSKNACFDMEAENPTAIQNVIKAAKSNCINSEYSSLEEKVKNLEIESKNLNSENFKEKLEKLENEIKNSKFPNFFQKKLQNLKATKAMKEEEEKHLATTTATQETSTIPKTATTSDEICLAKENMKIISKNDVDQIKTDVKTGSKYINNSTDRRIEEIENKFMELENKFEEGFAKIKNAMKIKNNKL